jgi:hypothetical protein
MDERLRNSNTLLSVDRIAEHYGGGEVWLLLGSNAVSGMLGRVEAKASMNTSGWSPVYARSSQQFESVSPRIAKKTRKAPQPPERLKRQATCTPPMSTVSIRGQPIDL